MKFDVNVFLLCLTTEMQSLTVLNLGFNRVSGAVLVHLRGRFIVSVVL